MTFPNALHKIDCIIWSHFLMGEMPDRPVFAAYPTIIIVRIDAIRYLCFVAFQRLLARDIESLRLQLRLFFVELVICDRNDLLVSFAFAEPSHDVMPHFL